MVNREVRITHEDSSFAKRLRHFINTSNETPYSISKRAKVDQSSIRKFLNEERSLNLNIASKIAVALGLGLEPGDGRNRSIEKQLRLAIKNSGRSPYVLARMANVDESSIMKFLNEERGLNFNTASNIADILGLTLEPRQGKPSFVSDVVLAKESPREPKPWLVPPKILGRVKTPLTEKQYRVILALHDATPKRLTGAFLRATSEVPGSLAILRALKDSDPDWNAVIHFPQRGQTGYWISY